MSSNISCLLKKEIATNSRIEFFYSIEIREFVALMFELKDE